MLSRHKRKIIIMCFFAIFFARNNSCMAYDIIKATTVSNQTQNTHIFNDIQEAQMYDDAIYDEIQREDDLVIKTKNKIQNVFNKKRRNKTEIKSEDSTTEDISEEVNSEIKQEIEKTENFKAPIETTEISENHKFEINAQKISYNDETGTIHAIGDVEIIAKKQGVKLLADNAILDKNTQTLKLNSNVKIIKNDTEMLGDALIVDLNEQNILMDNPTLNAYSFAIKAQEGFLIENEVEMLNGVVKSTQKKDFPIMTRGFMRLDATQKDSFFDKVIFTDTDTQSNKSYKIETKEIVITTHKDHHTLLLKGSNVYYNNHKIVRNSDIEIISDKQRQIIETNAFEAGNLRNFGTYLGYGIVYKMPKGHTLKLMPTLAYGDSSIGVGAIARYRSRNGMVDGGWNTASENLVVRGKYQLSNSLSLAYGRNAYLPEGFMGGRRSGYAGQLQYTKSYKIKDLNATFSNGVYAGIFSDYQKHDQEDAYSTTRFRYMAQLNKNILKYKNKEQGFTVSLDAITQGAATVYGSGETFGIVRIGPQIKSRYKRWESSIGYFLSGIHGDSPFWFDKYIYGKSTVTLNEKFYLNDKFSFGFRMFVTPMKDNYKEDLLTECRFYVIAGPKDAKIALSYDFVRDVAHMDFMFLIGSDNSHIKFDKLTTKNMDNKEEKHDFYKHAKPIEIKKPENI